MQTCSIKTPLGIAQIAGDQAGICSIRIIPTSEKISEHIPLILQDCVVQLNAYFSGHRTSFDLKLNPSGTDFQKQVWHALQTIPYGKTFSYLQLSQHIGNPKAIRAVANANGKNPLWIVIPCHRVIGSDGSLTGYAGGLHQKQWLLNHENPRLQQSLF